MSPDVYWLLVLVAAFGISGPIGGLIRKARGGTFMLGYFLGVLAGPVGWLVAAFMPRPEH